MKNTNTYLNTFLFDKDYPVHHSNRNSLENKIYAAIDHLEPFLPVEIENSLRDVLQKKKGFENEGFQLLTNTLASIYLITFDLPGKDIAMEFAESRLQKVFSFASKNGADYYLSEDEKKKLKVPKKYYDMPVLNPIFDPWVGICPLPTIHDVYLMNAVLKADKTYSQSINKIIKSLMQDSYQKEVVKGYGYSYFINKKRVYACGWSCHISDDLQETNFESNTILPRLILYSNFDEAKKTKRFKNAQKLLHNVYVANNNMLPEKYLKESGSGYWVTGAFMSFREMLTAESRQRISEIRLKQTGILS